MKRSPALADEHGRSAETVAIDHPRIDEFYGEYALAALVDIEVGEAELARRISPSERKPIRSLGGLPGNVEGRRQRGEFDQLPGPAFDEQDQVPRIVPVRIDHVGMQLRGRDQYRDQSSHHDRERTHAVSHRDYRPWRHG